MGCRCNERRAAIVVSARAMKARDMQRAADQAKFVVTSMVQDAGTALASRVKAAKQRLGRR